MIRKFILGLAIAISSFSIIAGISSADQGGVPNQQACFGQGRSGYATTSAPGAVGDAASERKGTNAQLNAEYKEACQNATS